MRFLFLAHENAVGHGFAALLQKSMITWLRARTNRLQGQSVTAATHVIMADDHLASWGARSKSLTSLRWPLTMK
jgi:hypothetical protein